MAKTRKPSTGSLMTHVPIETLRKHLPVILNSGLFVLDDNNKPIALYRLQARTKKPYKRKSKVVFDIPSLYLRVLANKINHIIYCYKNNIPHSPYIGGLDIDKELNDFESQVMKILGNHLIQKDEVEPHLTKFINKAKKVLKIKFEKEWFPENKDLTKKERWFYYLVSPIYGFFDKYLTDQKTGKRPIPQDDIFHYTSHLLISSGIEEIDIGRGHFPLYEKIKQYNQRHDKYLKK